MCRSRVPQVDSYGLLTIATKYSGKEVVDLELTIDESVLRLMSMIDAYASQDKRFDFGLKAQYFTLDVISDLAFGKPFGDLATDSDVYDYIRSTEQSMPNIVVAAVLPSLLHVLSWPLLRRLLPSEDDANGFGRLIRCVLSASHLGSGLRLKA